MKLNLGCGGDYKEGYINCDIVGTLNVDKIVDLEKKLPFKENTVEEIIVFHVLEHINNFIPLIDEFYRISKNHAKIFIRVPYFTIPGAFGNPTHVRCFTYGSWDYFNGKEFKSYSGSKFKILERQLISSTKRKCFSKIIDKLVNKNPKKYERFFSHILPMQEIKVVLEVIK